MPRARQIKPDLFRNGELFEIAGAEGVLFFEALWTLADREGRLEDRPLTIKATGCPLVSLDPDETLWKMHERGFVLRYVCNGLRFIQIVNFRKHQYPHRDEPASIIAPMEGFEHPWCEKNGSNVTWYPAMLNGSPVDAQLHNLTGRVPLPCSYSSPTVEPQLHNSSPTVALPSSNSSATPLTHNLSITPPCPPLRGGVPAEEPATEPDEPRSDRRKPKRLIPDNWKPSPQAVKTCRANYPGVTNEQIRASVHEFRSYWLADGGTKADWSQAWHNSLAKRDPRTCAMPRTGADLVPNDGIWIITANRPPRPDNAEADWVCVKVDGFVDWFPPESVPIGAKEWRG